jgi:hypothetical protein
LKNISLDRGTAWSTTKCDQMCAALKILRYTAMGRPKSEMPLLEPRPANLRPKPYILLKLLPIPSASSSLLPSYSSGGAFRRVKFALNYITVVITLTLHGTIPLLMRQLYDPSTLDFPVVWNTWHYMSAFTTSFCGRGFHF